MGSTIWTIAKYERKILMRSWFFRIFSLLSLFILFVFNMGEISQVGDMKWVYRAVPSNMPYANIFMLNIAQAIIAVFLSSEFIKRDRKQDTTEVFYTRSMSNGAYMIGKAISIISIFLLINVVVLIMGLIFNLLSLNTSVDWQAYVYYPLLISIPTLLYIVGLSCLMMSIVRNQALTFILLLGYILSSLIYIRSSYHYLFDYMAFYLPLFHSDITGFHNWPMILTLRGMYASLGLGFIFLSVLLFKRLPQSRLMNGVSIVLGFGLTAFGLFLGYQHWNNYQEKLNLPKQMIALNNAHLDHARIDIEKHAIHLEQMAHSFKATSTITGQAKTTANEFVFTLNPGLQVSAITSNGKALQFNRQLQLLLVQTDTVLQKGTAVNWVISYEGQIDERALFPDIDEKIKIRKDRENIFDLGKSHTFNQPEFLLLSPEAQWYPQPGVGYSDSSPFWYTKDFLDYQLTVKTLPGLLPVSLGQAQETTENTYVFEQDFLLSQLSLSIGKYEKATLEVDSLMNFEVYYIEGHDYFKTAFQEIRDTIPSILRDRLGDFERRSGLKYPFQSFKLVEVPGSFKSFDRTWTSVHETNQPGLVYIPEKGLYTRRFDFDGSEKRQKRWGRNRNKTKEELQISVFYKFLDEFFRFKNLDANWSNQETTVEEAINPYYQFAQFYEFSNNLASDQWPVLNRVFESYLRNDNSVGPEWMRRSSGSTQNELANMALQEKSFAEILTLKENQELIDNVIELKGEMLFSMMQSKAKTDRFREYIIKILQENQFQNLDFQTFEAQLNAEFGVDLSQNMPKWFSEKELPKYLITAPSVEKVLADDREMTRVRFLVTNYGSAEGVIKVAIRAKQPIDKLLFLEPQQTREVFYLSGSETSGILFNTLSSGNLPNQIEYTFENINKTAITNASEREAVIEDPVSLKNSGEIIVDNESAGFEFSHYEEVSRLRKWLKTKEEEDFKYKGTRVWRPPFNWTATTNDRLFGEFVRSAFYIKAGDGSKEAKWKIPIEEPGRYDVFYHVYKDQSFEGNRNQRGKYQFIIPHQSGVDRPSIELNNQSPDGWTSLGNYEFTSDTITITLSNESRLRAIFADAVKLVQMD